MSSELAGLLKQGSLRALFQPIVDRTTRVPIGYEGLIRGPVSSALHLPGELFAAAAAEGETLNLERASVEAVLRDFAALELPGRLFINVLPQTLMAWEDFASWLDEALARHRLDPHELVVEITEHGVTEDHNRLTGAVASLRALGCDVALDDLGAGASGLKTWSVIRPDFVKVDRYFVSGIEDDPVRAEILRSVVDMACALGCRVIAEGVENAAQCELVLGLGVDHVQGYFLGRPQAVPRVSAVALAPFDRPAAVIADCAEHLAREVRPLTTTDTVGRAVELFRLEPAWSALAVVDGDRPVGLIRRDELLTLLSRPLHPEIYNRKSVTTVMESRPILVDARARLEQVSRLVTGGIEGARSDEFIITRHGSYLGVGRMIDLLREITAQQIQVARHSNPLTGLPGNVEIQSRLSEWLTRRRPFVACHLDVDHFKAFNDCYGYARGDQVLLHVATTLAHTMRPRVDFVGHVGGDDFVFLLRSQDWSLRLLSLLDDLAASLLKFHDPEHREAGGLSGHDRDGRERVFPLLSTSIAAVAVDGSAGSTPEGVAEQLRRTKQAAKGQAGNSCILATNEGQLVDLRNRPLLQRDSAPEEGETLILARA